MQLADWSRPSDRLLSFTQVVARQKLRHQVPADLREVTCG